MAQEGTRGSWDPRWRPGSLPTWSRLIRFGCVFSVVFLVRCFPSDVLYRNQALYRPTGKSPHPPFPSGPAHSDFLASLTSFDKKKGLVCGKRRRFVLIRTGRVSSGEPESVSSVRKRKVWSVGKEGGLFLSEQDVSLRWNQKAFLL